MLRIRRFEERSLRAYQQGHIGGFLHLYIGQEAVAVGSVSVMDANDHVITAYRDHGHALGRWDGYGRMYGGIIWEANRMLKGQRWFHAFLRTR